MTEYRTTCLTDNITKAPMAPNAHGARPKRAGGTCPTDGIPADLLRQLDDGYGDSADLGQTGEKNMKPAPVHVKEMQGGEFRPGHNSVTHCQYAT